MFIGVGGFCSGRPMYGRQTCFNHCIYYFESLYTPGEFGVFIITSGFCIERICLFVGLGGLFQLQKDFVCLTVNHCRRILHQDFEREDFVGEDFVWEDFVREDFVREDFVREDFVQEDFVREDFVREDFEREDFPRENFA